MHLKTELKYLKQKPMELKKQIICITGDFKTSF